MPLKIADNTEVKISINAFCVDKRVPRWNLSSWSLWGGVRDGYRLEELAANSIGSSTWLWDDNDTALFLRQSRALFAVAIRVPELFILTSHHQFLTHNAGNEELIVSSDKDFSLQSCNYSIYDSGRPIASQARDEGFFCFCEFC